MFRPVVGTFESRSVIGRFEQEERVRRSGVRISILVIAVYVAIAETSEAAASLRWLLGRPPSSLFVSEERKERQYGVMRLLIRFSFALPVATRLG